MGLLPREGRFFDAFNQHAALAVSAARELSALFEDLPSLETRSRAIESFEKQADRVTHETVKHAAQDVHHAVRPRTRSTGSSPAWTTSST